MAPRVAAAQISHETNAFSTVKTDFAAFEASGLHLGREATEAARDTNTELAGFVTGAAEQNFELVPIVAVWATPSGLVTREAIERLSQILADGLRAAMAEGPLDGVLLAHVVQLTRSRHVAVNGRGGGVESRIDTWY